MRAVRVVRHGEPLDAVVVEDVDEPPPPDPGSAVVRVAAASLNFGDLARCRGGVASVVAEPPFTLGMDVCGTVEAVGDEAGVAVGDRVVAMTTMSLGGMAELASVPLTSTFPAPPALDDVEAASLLLPAHLAVLALERRARLQPGETLVVTAAASGVGSALVQVGVAAGATVVAVVGPEPGKADAARALGAHHVVDRSSADLFDAVNEVTGGRGADVVADLVGGDATEALWTVAGREARILPLGFNDDPEAGMTGRPLRKVATGNLTVLGVVLAYLDLPPDFRRFGLSPWPPAVGREVHQRVLQLIAGGALRPTVGRVVGFDVVAAALADHAARRTTGRTVLRVAP